MKLTKRISQEILFGSTDKGIFEDMSNLYHRVPEALLNPLDILTFQLLSKLNLNPYTNNYKKEKEAIYKRILGEFRKLEKVDHKEKNTFLGGLVNYNR